MAKTRGSHYTCSSQAAHVWATRGPRSHTAPNSRKEALPFQTSLELGFPQRDWHLPGTPSNSWGRKVDLRAKGREANEHMFRANYVLAVGQALTYVHRRHPLSNPGRRKGAQRADLGITPRAFSMPPTRHPPTETRSQVGRWLWVTRPSGHHK